VSNEVKLSVVVNSCNYGKYVRQAIESVLSQDYPHKELIIVDDGSSDDSPEIIRGYAGRARTFLQDNRGQAKACLSVVRHCTGTHIQFLDADDFLAPGALSRIAEACQPGVAKIQFQLTPVDDVGAVLGPAFPPEADLDQLSARALIDQYGYYATPPTSGNVYRADVFSYIDSIDYEAAIDGIPYLLAPFLGDVVQINAPLGFYRVHSRNLSGFSQGLSDFTRLSGDTLRQDGDRQIHRLRHLRSIIEAHGLPTLGRTDFTDTTYVLERQMLGEVADDKAPPPRLLLRYWASLMKEPSSVPKKTAFMAWAFLLGLTPTRTRKQLALLRLNPYARREVLRSIGLAR
jgi:glycosyltransferase involved in cell wall biosynthesis